MNMGTYLNASHCDVVRLKVGSSLSLIRAVYIDSRTTNRIQGRIQSTDYLANPHCYVHTLTELRATP